MNVENTKLNKLEQLILLCSLIFMIFMIISSDRLPLYDEDDYLSNVPLLHKYGLSNEYLLHHFGSAGPLYPVLHYFLEPLTQLRVPYVRLVNIGLLAGIIYFISLTLKLLHFSNTYALYVLAIPLTYTLSGLGFRGAAGLGLLVSCFHLSMAVL